MSTVISGIIDDPASDLKTLDTSQLKVNIGHLFSLQFDGELWFLSCFQLITNISVLSSSDSGTNFHKNSKKISLQQHSVCDRSCIWRLFLLVNKPNHNFDPVIFHKKPRNKFYTISVVVWE